jgi:hypothetical protein
MLYNGSTLSELAGQKVSKKSSRVAELHAGPVRATIITTSTMDASDPTTSVAVTWYGLLQPDIQTVEGLEMFLETAVS